VLNASRLDRVLSIVEDADLEVLRSALLMVNAAVRHHPELVSDKLREPIVPLLLNALDVKLERKVDLGPFKHTIDDGLPLRRDALMVIISVFDASPQKLDLNRFMPKLVACLSDTDEIKLQAYQMICKIRKINQAALIGHLELFIDPLKKSISKFSTKPTDGQAAGPEADRAAELVRSAIKAITAINKIEDSQVNRKWTEFVESLRANPIILAMFGEFETERSNDLF